MGTLVSPQLVAALAFVRALDSAHRRLGHPTSNYIESVKQNLRTGNGTIDAQVKVAVGIVVKASPTGWADAGLTDHIRIALRSELATAGDPEVRAACDLLATHIGGSALTYYNTWGKIPP